MGRFYAEKNGWRMAGIPEVQWRDWNLKLRQGRNSRLGLKTGAELKS